MFDNNIQATKITLISLVLAFCGTQIASAQSLDLKHDASTCYAYSSDGEGSVYCTKRIKSRANRNYTNNGTAIYSHTEITEWDDDIDLATEEDVDLLGNVKARDGVREVHNLVDVQTDVDTNMSTLRIGNVDVYSDTSTINNMVTIDGDINANSPGGVEIGTVTSRGGSLQSISSSIATNAINTNSKRITIGGVKVQNARKLRKIESRVRIRGAIATQ